MFNWQLLAVAAVVLLAAGYLGLRAVRLFRKSEGAGCGTCGSCSSDAGEPSVVGLTLPKQDKIKAQTRDE